VQASGWAPFASLASRIDSYLSRLFCLNASVLSDELWPQPGFVIFLPVLPYLKLDIDYCNTLLGD
jgi:hypothetical protein